MEHLVAQKNPTPAHFAQQCYLRFLAILRKLIFNVSTHITYIHKISLWRQCSISNAIHYLTFICGLSPFPLVDCHESRLPLIGSLTPPLVSGSTNKHFSFESISCEPSASFHYNINIIFYSNSNFVAILAFFLQLLTEIWKLVWWILPMILGLFRLEAHTLIEP